MARFPSGGEDFASYHITRRLGRGGMGVVFAADHRALGRVVALKVLSPELATQADYRARFTREAGVLARLDSPHVVQVVDHGEHDGCLYIATQYVAGGDLSEALRRHGPVPVAQAAQVAEQVAWALGDSHAAGIVHRDVKPSNVLLREISSEVFVYLCDFGIAQDRDPGLTAPGSVAGTFAYLAPERLRGEPASAASDFYALGCVLFTSLIGSAPYAGSDVQIGMSHLNAPVPQVVESSPVAAAVNAVLRRSMAKDPAHRYPDARAMRADLRDLGRLAQSPHPPLSPLTPLTGSAPGTPPPPAAAPPFAVVPAPPGPQGPPGAPPPPGWGPGGYPPAPRRRRTALVVTAAVVAVVAVVLGVTIAVATTGDDGEPEARGSSSTGSPTDSPDSPTEPTEPTTSVPTTTAPPDPPEPDPKPKPKPKPKPFYPAVPPASGVRVVLGTASLNAPAGWGTINRGIVDQGVGARDYSDLEGFYSSVFIRRSVPTVRLNSIPLLEIAAQGSVEPNDKSITLETSELLPGAWLDDQQAVRIRAVYYSPGDDLYFTEETWFAQRGRFLYRITFQHSRIDTLDERRAQIDPMVVSFRWS